MEQWEKDFIEYCGAKFNDGRSPLSKSAPMVRLDYAIEIIKPLIRAQRTAAQIDILERVLLQDVPENEDVGMTITKLSIEARLKALKDAPAKDAPSQPTS